MTAKHITLGRRGEDLAAAFFRRVGAEVLVRNYRWGRAEIDSVISYGNSLRFVEVKTRRYPNHGGAQAAVTRKKQGLIMAAAGRYMQEARYDGPFYFDIVTVIVPVDTEHQIFWRKDAFGFDN